jgi:flagellin
MSSLLTNTSAMVALQTLKTINRDLGKAQDMISTGMQIANAKDNAAIWGIATTMRSDISGFKAISESLSLGTATLSVARDGAEAITGVLDQLKGKVVAAQEENVDRNKIQADVEELRDQIITIVDAAQFNGLNLLKGDPAQPTIDILASLNRSDSGVTADHITFARRPLEAGKAATEVAVTAPLGAADNDNVIGTLGRVAPIAETDLASVHYTAGDMITLELTNASGQGIILEYTITQTYLDTTGSDLDDLASRIVTEFGTQLTAANTAGTFDSTGITFTQNGTPNLHQLEINFATTLPSSTAAQLSDGGGLASLTLLDVTNKQNAKAALDGLETMIQNTINAAAEFGSAQGRITTQDEYISKIIDGLTSGVGALVDADMEAASARLQALQVQQQLGIQALTIANQQPQNILALFQG